MQSSRFRKLTDRFGWKIRPITCIINGKLTRRPDILAVENHGLWEMTIPKRIYSLSDQTYTDLLGLQHPSYFECESKAYSRKYGK
jgi:hypothetical protein